MRARREQVNAAMGLWGADGATWKASELLPAPSTEFEPGELEARATERNLELELSRRRFAAAAKNANVQRAKGWVPELRAGVSAERDLDPGADWAIGPAI